MILPTRSSYLPIICDWLGCGVATSSIPQGRIGQPVYLWCCVTTCPEEHHLYRSESVAQSVSRIRHTSETYENTHAAVIAKTSALFALVVIVKQIVSSTLNAATVHSLAS
jgi:hypothetical protein